ncbi:MAG: transglutaminase domain-containing protein [Armatimonadota bacterium]
MRIGLLRLLFLIAAVLAVAGVLPLRAAETAALKWDLSQPEYDPPTCPSWARVAVPEWVRPFQGKNGMPEPWHSKKGSVCGGNVEGIDRYQANLFVVYRPETAKYLYAEYTPKQAGYVRGTLPGYEKVVEQYTTPKMRETEKALALLTQAMPAVFRHVGIPPLWGKHVPGTRNLMDEPLLASGGGWCNEQARVFIRLCQVAGLQGRMVHLFGQSHTIAEFYADGRWVLADASYLFVPRDERGKLLSVAACHDQGAGQRAYARSKQQRFKELAAMTAEQLNMSQDKLEAERKQWLAFDADALAKQKNLCFAVINYPVPPTAEAAQSTPAPLSKAEIARRELNAKFDKTNLRQKTEFVVDRSEEFITRPKAELAGEFTVAKAAPTVKLKILPNLEPEYFSEKAYQAGWASWGHVTRSEDNRFYFGASDHRGQGAGINLYEYRPKDNVVERVLDVRKLLGWTDETYTDGKLHGEMGIMPDGTLWAGTHYGPHPTDEWIKNGYRGSWLFSYNINTKEAKNWGVPLIVHNLDCHLLDTQRGIFAATGSHSGMFLSWDVNKKHVRYAGYLPNGWKWWARAMLLDAKTGYFWGMDDSAEPYRFLAFDPELNRFKRFEVPVPANPMTKAVGKLRGHTHTPDAEGWYYWATINGAFFRFRPNWEKGPEVEVLGTTWDKGRDVLQIAIDPSGRYLYYQPKGDNAPLVQYDVKTKTKKAIGFLQDYYFEKYGYSLGSQVYGLEVSKDGSFVVIVDNGTFGGRGSSFGHPALTVVTIPKEERP